MAYTHIGHNCELGNKIVLSNSVQVARGEDKYNHHEIIKRTNALMSEESILLRKKEND